MPNCFDIHALSYKLWSGQIWTDEQMHTHTRTKIVTICLAVTCKRARQKLLKDHNSGKNQSSMTSLKYDYLQVMGTIIGKFHQNPLKTVGGVAETVCVYGQPNGQAEGWMDGRTDGRTQTNSPFRLMLGDNNVPGKFIVHYTRWF